MLVVLYYLLFSDLMILSSFGPDGIAEAELAENPDRIKEFLT